jgi:hypothetical protein
MARNITNSKKLGCNLKASRAAERGSELHAHALAQRVVRGCSLPLSYVQGTGSIHSSDVPFIVEGNFVLAFTEAITTPDHSGTDLAGSRDAKAMIYTRLHIT